MCEVLLFFKAPFSVDFMGFYSNAIFFTPVITLISYIMTGAH